MRQEESVPVPRGWTGGAAWKGAGASLLLHLFVGAAVIVALSGPPKAGTAGGRPHAPAARRNRPAPRPARSSPRQNRQRSARGPSSRNRPPLPPPRGSARRPADDPPDATAPANPSDPAANGIAPGPDLASPCRRIAHDRPGSRQGNRGESARDIGCGSPPAADFAWIRDAIQGAIAYPSTARRMGWEGKVVVAFHLLSDGSVRDVRVLQGSGHAALDRGAIDAVRNASPFPRSPVEAEVITPVVYRLTTR